MSESQIHGMIDISDKKIMLRISSAEGYIHLSDESIARITNKTNEKGDVLENAKLAAIQGAKMTPQLVFMAHPIKINSVKAIFRIEKNNVHCTVTIKAIDKTGVEIEAVAAVMNALLAIFDLSKRYEKDENGEYQVARISGIKVTKKTKEEL